MQPTKQLGWGCVLVICCLLLCLNCGVELSLLVTCHIGQKHEFSYWMKIAWKENFSPMIKLTCRYYTWLYCSSVYAAILKKYYSWLSFHKSWQSLWSTINFKGIRIYFQFPLTKIFTAIKSIGIWALHNYMIESFRLFIIHEDHTYRFWDPHDHFHVEFKVKRHDILLPFFTSIIFVHQLWMSYDIKCGLCRPPEGNGYLRYRSITSPLFPTAKVTCGILVLFFVH